MRTLSCPLWNTSAMKGSRGGMTTAIIQQAKDDVMHFAPGTPLREDAEAFFLSEAFYGMTNLDGFDILCKIQDKYDEKQRKREAKLTNESNHK